jgi:YVTN family beta-propeller protein
MFRLTLALALCCAALPAQQKTLRTWEVEEIELRSSREYPNPYTDVECWVELKGPGFAKRVYGFWDGGNMFRVRVVATTAGAWAWTSGSNQPADAGLNGKSGGFTANEWTEAEKQANPNRRGFLRPTANGHALQYADGTPYFMVGDTWLGAATWRLPFTGGAAVDAGYEPGPGVTFEAAVQYRKRQGFNSVSMIAAFPTWASDQYANTYADRKGVYLRNAWEAFGMTVDGKTPTAKAMHDEQGYRSFEVLPNRDGLADFDRIVPHYFQSLDRKMRYLSEQGFVPMIETIRRDVAPAWKAYFNFNESFPRFVQYMAARYGAYNFVFSKVHFDIYLKNYAITGEEFNEALNIHFKKYGPMPFGQPVTALIDHSTAVTFGHAEKAPWITMHATGNKPRDHGIYEAIEALFRLSPPYPAIDLEPYYTGWMHPNNVVAGERPQPDTDRDNYFSRAQMYGCVLSGALSGHVHGTGAYDITVDTEPAGTRPYFWQALRYKSAGYMKWLERFVMSEGAKYRDLEPASGSLAPRKADGSRDTGLDGWSFMMRTRAKDFALVYFENQAHRARAAGWNPNGAYRFVWFNTQTGEWQGAAALRADDRGELQLPPFPGGAEVAATDWAAQITAYAAEGKPSYAAVEKVSGHVGFYDADGKILKEVALGGHPHEMTFSADGRYLYTTDNGVLWMTETGQGGNTVSIVDTRTQSLAGTISLGNYRRPHGIDFDPKTGNLLVTTELPSMLLVVDPRTRRVVKEHDIKGKAPHLVRLAPDAVWAYTSNTDTGTVSAVNLRNGEVKVIPVGERPQGMAFSPDGRRLYVTNMNSDSISVIDTQSKARIGDIPTGKGPVRIMVTPDGKTAVYALQTGEAVGFANLETRKEEAQVKLTGQPVSLTFSADNRVAFSAVQSQDRIFAIPLAARKIEKVISAPAGAGPDPYLPLR